MKIESILGILKIAFAVFGWFWGEKANRRRRAKEIVDLLGKIKKEGDVLGAQIHKEMQKHSDTDWDDIRPRDTQ